MSIGAFLGRQKNQKDVLCSNASGLYRISSGVHPGYVVIMGGVPKMIPVSRHEDRVLICPGSPPGKGVDWMGSE